MRTASRVLLTLAIVAAVLGALALAGTQLPGRAHLFYSLVFACTSAALGLFALVAGSIALILGLASRGKSNWVAGAAVNVVSLALVAFGSMAAIQAGRTCVSNFRGEMWAGSDANMRQWFKSGVGIDLPPQAAYLSGRDYSFWLSEVYMKIRVPAGFKAVLDQRLTRVTTQPEELHPPQNVRADQPDWGAPDFAHATFYQHRTGNVNTGGFETTLALDERTGVMYCVFIEYAP